MAKKVTLEEEFEKNKGELSKEDFNNVTDWCKNQPHLPHIPDVLVALFLQSCHYKLDYTKVVINNYFTIRSETPEVFSNRDPFTNDLVNGKPVVEYSMLNKTTPENYRVLYVKIGISEADKFNLTEVCKSFTMHSDLDLYLNGSYPGHITKLQLGLLRKILTYLQEAMPVRLKGWHIINVTSVLSIIFSMIKPFLKKELVDMMHFHSSGMDSLYEFVPKNILPRDYGGEDKSSEELMRDHLKLLQEHNQYFKEEEKLRIIDSKKK